MKVMAYARDRKILVAIRFKLGLKRRLNRRVDPGVELDHSPRRLNELLKVFGTGSSYLEIGVQNGYTLEKVQAQTVVGVDPNPQFSLLGLPRSITIHPICSDQYFDNDKNFRKFDVIFIDGFHEISQVVRDFENATKRLKTGGAILLDDTVPVDEISAMNDQDASLLKRKEASCLVRSWHGDVWKILYLFLEHGDGLNWRTIMGSGNPQTLVWLRTEFGLKSGFATKVEEIRDLQYSHCFQNGLPAFFNPCDELTAIRDWKIAVRSSLC